jgi:hypothetical protein
MKTTNYFIGEDRMTEKKIAKCKDAAEMTPLEANIAAVDELPEAVKGIRKLVLELTKRTGSEELENADLRLFEMCRSLKAEGARLKKEWKGLQGGAK